MAVESRVPLPAECEERPGKARYRDAALPHGDIRERVLLALTRGVLQDTQHKSGVLGREDTEEPGARPGELPCAAGERLAGDRHLGVPTQARPHRPHDARSGTAAEQQPPVVLQASHPHPLQHRRGHPAPDGR